MSNNIEELNREIKKLRAELELAKKRLSEKS